MFGILLAIVALIAFPLIYLMERRLKTRGALFTGPATLGMRVLALVLGLLFAGLFVLELTSSETILIWFPILAVALLSYGLGAGRLLGRLQRGTSSKGNITESFPHPSASEGTASEALKQEETTRFPTNRLLRFVITLVIVLAVLALALYGAVWATTHPNDPFALVYVVGLIVLFVLACVFEWFKFLRYLFK